MSKPEKHHEHEVPQSRFRTASNDGFHVASEDYPELEEILVERPPLEHVSEIDTTAKSWRVSLSKKFRKAARRVTAEQWDAMRCDRCGWQSEPQRRGWGHLLDDIDRCPECYSTSVHMSTSNRAPVTAGNLLSEDGTTGEEDPDGLDEQLDFGTENFVTFSSNPDADQYQLDYKRSQEPYGYGDYDEDVLAAGDETGYSTESNDSVWEADNATLGHLRRADLTWDEYEIRDGATPTDDIDKEHFELHLPDDVHGIEGSRHLYNYAKAEQDYDAYLERQAMRMTASVEDICSRCGNELPQGQGYGICRLCVLALNAEAGVQPFPERLNTVNGSRKTAAETVLCFDCGWEGSPSDLEDEHCPACSSLDIEWDEDLTPVEAKTAIHKTAADVVIYLNEDQNSMFFDWSEDESDAPNTLRRAIRLDVDGSGEDAAETAYAICNSYPEEMFCDPEYYGDVVQYRRDGNRSLSVGDVVWVSGVWYVVASFGFKQIDDPANYGVQVTGSKKVAVKQGEVFYDGADWYVATGWGKGAFWVVKGEATGYGVVYLYEDEDGEENYDIITGMDRYDAEDSSERWANNPNTAPFDATWQNDWTGFTGTKKTARACEVCENENAYQHPGYGDFWVCDACYEEIEYETKMEFEYERERAMYGSRKTAFVQACPVCGEGFEYYEGVLLETMAVCSEECADVVGDLGFDDYNPAEDYEDWKEILGSRRNAVLGPCSCDSCGNSFRSDDLINGRCPRCGGDDWYYDDWDDAYEAEWEGMEDYEPNPYDGTYSEASRRHAEFSTDPHNLNAVPYPGQVEYDEATLHDEPEAALPRTDGNAIVDEALDPQNYDEIGDHEDAASDVVASKSRSWIMEGGSQGGDFDIAGAAKEHLKTALKTFSPSEQAEIINEGEGVTASNLDRLQIEGTHYEILEEQLARADETGEDVIWW